MEEGLSLAQTTELGVIVSHLCPSGGGRALGHPGQPSSLLVGGQRHNSPPKSSAFSDLTLTPSSP